HLVEPQRPEHRIATDSLHQHGIAGDDPGLRASQQLIAAEGNQVRSRSEAFADERLVDSEGAQIYDAAAAQVFINRNTALASQGAQIAQLGPRRESLDAKIARVHAHQQTRAVSNRVP